MFPSCLDLTRSFNIWLFISLLFIIPVANLRLPICIRIASLSVRFFFVFFVFFFFQLSNVPFLASKKTFLFVYFLAAISRSKMQISSSTYCFVVKRKNSVPMGMLIHGLLVYLGNYVTLTTFYE